MTVSKRVRTLCGLFVTALVVAFSSVTLTAPASAAPSHHGTDPYVSGCASSAFTFSTRAVSGGTINVKGSTACGTQWVEYSGVAQYTAKQVNSAWGAITPEVDYTSWAYSMQAYAPGINDQIDIWVQVGSTSAAPTIGYCTSSCTWLT